MKKTVFTFCMILFLIWNMASGQPIIIDHNCSKLEPIPEWAILQARSNLHIAYGHTSHGSQLTEGMTSLAEQDTNLAGYKGDIYCWEYYWEYGTFECLDLDDYFRGGDLGHNGDTTWAASTRDYLENDPFSGDINVVMWSWCGGCSDNTVEGIQIYLNKMNELEQDYPDINFVYMTGHRDIWSDDTLKRNNQLIRDYCFANDKILFDFADIESYDPDGNYYEYVNDNCNYYDENLNYLGNWATEWQNSHAEGADWYNCYAAHSEPLNGNMKAYAAWWMFCRLAGWDGSSASNYYVDLTAFSEGPFNGTDMNTGLNPGNLPLSQPYDISPWNYTGTESVGSIPNNNVVDWVLVELRDATDAASATSGTMIEPQAAFLLNDGSVVDLDGTSILTFNHSINHFLFVVIWHRNHLGIMSANALTESSSVYTYDYTTPAGQAYGTDAQKNLGSVYGMFAADGNADGTIDELDITGTWATDAGNSGYLNGDFNMNTQADNIDKNNVWLSNEGVECQVPCEIFFSCGDILIDSRDGQTYTTVQIGTQCWMAENLNIGTMINGSGNQNNNSIIEKYCYDNNTINCDTYGGLYQWNEMMEYNSIPGVQGICPTGWHIPSDAEWCTLENYVDAGTISCSSTGWRGIDAGGNLKETGTTHWLSPNTGATNSSGFTVLPGGYRDLDGSFDNLTIDAYFWSSNENGSSAWGPYLYYLNKQVYRHSSNKMFGNSVRCVRD